MAMHGNPGERPEVANPANIEDNTLDEQHAGMGKRTLPLTDNDQSGRSVESHVAAGSDDDQRRRVAESAYRRAERRGFASGHELEDWLEAERDQDGGNAG